MKIRLSILLLAFVYIACSTPQARFIHQPGEQERRMVRTYPYPIETVWKSVERVVDDYHIHTKDRVQGLLLTRWRMTVVRGKGTLSEGRNFSHGMKIREYSDYASDPSEQGEFEVHNRLHITVVPEGDSTTVAVTNYFWVNTHDYDPDQTVKYGAKAFSTWEFDTREEFAVLDRIGEFAAKAKKN